VRKIYNHIKLRVFKYFEGSILSEMIEICGVLIHAKPGFIDGVQKELLTMPGVEIHEATDNNRLIVTVERVGKASLSDSLSAFNSIPNVLSATLIYEHAEEI